MTQPIRVGLVGLGKIAIDQHVPTLLATPGLVLAATASRNASLDTVPSFPTIEALLAEGPPLDAVAICTPPAPRLEAARAALRAGKHVLLEKPPCATVCAFALLVEEARRSGRTLHQSWHSRYAPGVAPAKAWLRGRQIVSGRITWRENVHVWHPGQDWIFQAGGFGVFDPGINALSILTEVSTETVFVESATLFTPGDLPSPIAAHLALRTEGGGAIEADFDFRETGPQTWRIEIETSSGILTLDDGGAVARVDGVVLPEHGRSSEYTGVYERLRTLVLNGQSDCDVRPLQLVADAFMVGDRRPTRYSPP